MPSVIPSSPSTSTSTSTSRSSRSISRRDHHGRSLPQIPNRDPRTDVKALSGLLASYVDARGRPRELLALPGAAGSVLVLDRDAITLCDRRLVAHLAADEPRENATLVCRHYLEDTNGRWCRRVLPEDLETVPVAQCGASSQHELDSRSAVKDRNGNSYRLAMFPDKHSMTQLRWCRRTAEIDGSVWQQIRLRDVIGALECYDPMRQLTEQAILHHRDDPNVLLTRLCREFERLCASPIVLNRGLREAVLDAINRRGATMSEIALHCGIVKRDRRGNLSGETSWLARRIGLMPEGGARAITPWIHSDVLAAIARKGLNVSPREVELL